MKLKIIQVNDYYVAVDENAEIKEENYYFATTSIEKCESKLEANDLTDICFKIIFAEPELNLDLPIIPDWKQFEVEQLAEKSNGYAYYGKPLGEKYLAFKEGFIEGYNHNKKLYTEEDMKNAFNAGYDLNTQEQLNISNDKREFLNENDFIKSLKKFPEYIVFETENVYEDVLEGQEFVLRPVEKRIKLITLPNGKQTGIINELIW